MFIINSSNKHIFQFYLIHPMISTYHIINMLSNKINELNFNEIMEDMIIENLKPYMYNSPFDICELSKNTSIYADKFIQQIKDKIKINKIFDEYMFSIGIKFNKFSNFLDIPSNDVGRWFKSSDNESGLSKMLINESKDFFMYDFFMYNDHNKDIIPDTSDSLYMILLNCIYKDNECKKIIYMIETDENIRKLINNNILQLLCRESSHIFHDIIKSFEDKLDFECWYYLCSHNSIHPTIKELIKNNLGRIEFDSKIKLYKNSCNNALDLIQIDLNNILDIRLLNILCENNNDKTYDILSQYIEHLDISCWMKLCKNKNKVIFNLVEQNLDKLNESCWKILWANPNIFINYDYELLCEFKSELHKEFKIIVETELNLYYIKHGYDIINACTLSNSHTYYMMSK